MGRDAQGCAWTSQAGAAVSNPFTSKLARDCETPSLILLRKWPCFVQKSLGKNTSLRLACQAGTYFENHGLLGWARMKTEAHRAALGQAKLAPRE